MNEQESIALTTFRSKLYDTIKAGTLMTAVGSVYAPDIYIDVAICKKKIFYEQTFSDFEMKVREAYLVAFITTVLTPASVLQSTNFR